MAAIERPGLLSQQRQQALSKYHLSWREALARLDEFALLEPDWDSYGADPISATAIARVRRLLERLGEAFALVVGERYLPMNIAPIADGGIQLEWKSEQRKLEVEIDAEGIVSSFTVDKTGGSRRTFEESDASESRVLTLVASMLLQMKSA